tara:strand:+ start:16210 stop:16668 length:459 start_codon:yes stop_codon:yes gene_type:complete
MTILIALFSFVLILLCLFTLLVVMVQKPKGDGGLGAALGGGSMEAAFGAETGSMLTKITIYAVIGFFILTFALYLGNIASNKDAEADSGESLLGEVVDAPAPDQSSRGVTPESALQRAIDTADDTVEAGEALSITLQENAVEAETTAEEAAD